MPRLAWLTDLHLGFADEDQVDGLINSIRSETPDAVLIGGDISEAPTFAAHLKFIAAEVNVPVYFVLGNHDFYHGSIEKVRLAANVLAQEHPNIHYLSAAGAVRLSEATALVGHDGWGDARTGDFLHSPVLLNDYFLITELARLMPDPGRLQGDDFTDAALRRPLRAALRRLGDEAATHFRTVLPRALEQARHVIVLMHVPPFREACWHKGRTSDDDWAPHFTCIAAGESLMEVMREHPDRRMTVLCGHTHGGGFAQILENLEVHTGPAEYGAPRMQPLVVTE